MRPACRACTKLTHAPLHRFRVHFPVHNHDSVQSEQWKKTVNFFTLSLEYLNFDFFLNLIARVFPPTVLKYSSCCGNFTTRSSTIFTWIFCGLWVLVIYYANSSKEQLFLLILCLYFWYHKWMMNQLRDILVLCLFLKLDDRQLSPALLIDCFPLSSFSQQTLLTFDALNTINSLNFQTFFCSV